LEKTSRPRRENDNLFIMADPTEAQAETTQRVRLAQEFLDPSDSNSPRSYRSEILLMLNRGLRRLIVSIDDIRVHSRELADGILNQPFDWLPAFDEALKSIVDTLPDRPHGESGKDVPYYCAYRGSFGENSCNPRTLEAHLLNRVVSLEGIVTRCSLVRPKVVKSVHYSEVQDKFMWREYRDQTMMGDRPTTTSAYPQQDEDGNPVSPCFKPIELG
jgi:DNA replication licensing factor MCM3